MEADETDLALKDYSTFSARGSLWRPVRERWLLVLGLPMALAALVLLVQALARPEYTAAAVLAPSERNGGSLSGQLGRIGGIAALAGGSLGLKTEVTEFDKFQFLLFSERLASYQVLRRDMAKRVFSRDWNATSGRWIRPDGVAQTVKDAVFPVFGLTPWSPPDGRDLSEHYGRKMGVRKIGDTGMVEVSYRDEDPQRALYVLRSAIDDSNLLLRRDAEVAARRKAAYLRTQIALATVAEYRQNLATLLANEEQTLMLTASNLPFAADLIQADSVSSQPTSQRPILYAMIALVAGLSLSTLLAIMLGSKGRADPATAI